MIWRLLAARRAVLATRFPDQDHPVGELGCRDPRMHAHHLQRNSRALKETSGQKLYILPVHAAWFAR